MEGLPQIPSKKEGYKTQESNRLQRRLIEVAYPGLNPSDAAFEWTREEEGMPSNAQLYAEYEKENSSSFQYEDVSQERLVEILEGMKELRRKRLH